jgi:hypothetical protein
VLPTQAVVAAAVQVQSALVELVAVAMEEIPVQSQLREQ